MEGLRLPSALVQTARDLASESLKAPRLEKRIKRKSLKVRYDKRTFKFYPDSHIILLNRVQGRLVVQASWSQAELEKFIDTRQKNWVDRMHQDTLKFSACLSTSLFC